MTAERFLLPFSVKGVDYFGWLLPLEEGWSWILFNSDYVAVTDKTVAQVFVDKFLK